MTALEQRRARVAELLDVTEEAVGYVSAVAYTEAAAGQCSPTNAAARIAHVQGISDGVRSALFALDGATPEEALAHIIREHRLRSKDVGAS